MQIPEEHLDRIMHVSLPIGSSVLMGSDSTSAFSPPLVVGNNFSISFEADSKEHADEVFAKLSDGGEVKWPMADAFWGAYFGAIKDKFGINWQVIAENPAALNTRFSNTHCGTLAEGISWIRLISKRR